MPLVADLDTPTTYHLGWQVVIAVADLGVSRHTIKNPEDRQGDTANLRPARLNCYLEGHLAEAFAVPKVHVADATEDYALVTIDLPTINWALHQHKRQIQEVEGACHQTHEV